MQNLQYFSTSNLSVYNIEDYMITKDIATKLLTDLYNWLSKLQEINGANRAIPLPYIIDIPITDATATKTVTTREETIMRKGNLITTNEKTLSEQSFWNYFVPTFILDAIYSKSALGRNAIDEKTEYDASEWKAATKLIMDIYALVKPGICDSILDENNNIVNFSSELEMPIVINKIEVKYKQN